MNQIQFWIVFFLHTVNQFNHTNITPQKISTNLNYRSVENTEAKQEWIEIKL